MRTRSRQRGGRAILETGAFVAIGAHQNDVGMSGDGANHLPFGIRQRVKAIEPHGGDIAHAFGRDAVRRQFQTARTQGQTAIREFAIDFAIDVQERGGQGSVRQVGRQPTAIASRGRELGDGAGEFGAEAAHVDHAREFRPVDAARRFFHDQVERGVRRLRHVRHTRFHKTGERLDQAAAKDEPFARQAILQMLRHGRGGHQQAHTVVAFP